jgi:hypothetical protein
MQSDQTPRPRLYLDDAEAVDDLFRQALRDAWSTLKVWGVRVAAKRGHKRAVVAVAPKQTRFTRMRWLRTDHTPAREGLKRATAPRALKSWSFHSKPLARHGREPTEKSNPTNQMRPTEGRAFILQS